MPNDENIVFYGFESGFAESFINGEEKRYVKDVLKKLHNSNNNIKDVLDNIENINEFIIIADYSFSYRVYNDIEIQYEYSNKYKSIDKNNDLYVLHKDTLVPVYQIRGLDDKSFYIINKNKMGKFCRTDYKDFFDINVIEFSNDEKSLQKTMNEEIQGCDLEGEEKMNKLLESVDLIIREYVKFDNHDISGFKLFYSE